MHRPSSSRPSDTPSNLHPLVVAAAGGELPDWAEADARRRRHMASVAELMSGWGEELGLEKPERVRWAAAAWLHDALRDADATSLVEDAGAYPAPLRHGPAVATRLAAAGVRDEELLDAIRHHTTGRPGLGRLGRFLYIADFLDPTREFDSSERSALRDRLPAEHREVARIVCARRIGYLLRRRLPIVPETVGFWNELVGVG